MHIHKIAAFSNGDTGGNPAGVLICDQHPSTEEMQKIAKDVGFSETAFAMPKENEWRVRYFSPESEVPFCGHATIALGAVLAKEFGANIYSLILNEGKITVESSEKDNQYSAALMSPPTKSRPLNDTEISGVLELFNLEENQLNPDIPPAFIHGGANHFLLALKSRELLEAMAYDFKKGQKFMRDNNLVTINLVYAQNPKIFHARNPFASGGVYEDPATGAAAAALGGYLRDLNWPHEGSVEILQGFDMGAPSKLKIEISDQKGASIQVSGTARGIK